MKKAMFKTLICLMLCVCILSAGTALAASADGNLIRYLPTCITINSGIITVDGYFVNLNMNHTVMNFTNLEMDVYIEDTRILTGSFGNINGLMIEPMGIRYHYFVFYDPYSLYNDVVSCDDTVYAVFSCGFSSMYG